MGPALWLEWSTRAKQADLTSQMRLISEAALCSHRCAAATGSSSARFRARRNGLPFVAGDMAIHGLLGEHTVVEAQRLQVALGRIRRDLGDYAGTAGDQPHRVQNYSERQMRRSRDDQKSRPFKVAPTFFALQPDRNQPSCFTPPPPDRDSGRDRTVRLAAEILAPQPGETMVLADFEHLSAELFQ